MGEMFEEAWSRMLDRIDSPRALLEVKLGGALEIAGELCHRAV